MKHYFIVMLALLPMVASAEPVRYEIDPAHTYPSFAADHMGLSVWRGKLNQSSGLVVLDKAADTGRVKVTIDLASIDFGLAKLNEWATGPKFFDVQTHPRAVYQGRLEGFEHGEPSRVDGELTLNGVTRPVDLKIRSFKCVPHPLNGRDLCGADATGHFQRDAFGLDAGADYGFDMTVRLQIQVEAVAPGPDGTE